VGGRITVGRFLDSSTDSVEVTQGTTPWVVNQSNGLIPAGYDYLEIAYDGQNRMSVVTFKTGGSGGMIVGTVTITYVGSTTRIATVTGA